MKRLTLVALLAVAGCKTVPLTAEEQSVRILRRSDPPASCREISRVTAPGLGSLTDQGREDDLKRATRKAGGNAVVVDKTDENMTIYGIAFTCP